MILRYSPSPYKKLGTPLAQAPLVLSQVYFYSERANLLTLL